MKFALIQLGEYAHMIGTSFLAALLFLGGWLGPGSDHVLVGALWFLLKAMFIFLLVTWVRWSFVRIRVDQILAISWKLLMPASIVLLLAAAFWVERAGVAMAVPEQASFLGETGQLVRAVGRARGVTFKNLLRRPITVRYPTVDARLSRPVPRHPRAHLRSPDGRGELHRLAGLCEYICPPTVIKVEMLKAESGTSPRPSRSSSTRASSASSACRCVPPTPSS